MARAVSRNIGNFLSLIKFSHTIFALPFALLGFFLATQDSGESLQWTTLIYVLLCMVFARSAAMAFNRYVDRDIDGDNPRTAVREIPAGVVSRRSARWFILFNCVAFVACAWLINPLCFYLSPVALAVVLGYSYTKRFTYFCHFVLGAGLALAPVGAYLAVTAQWAFLPILYGFIVLFWVAGFDIIYALQDEDFDRDHRLNSIPVRLGRVGALQLSRLLHISCGLLIAFAVYWQWQNYPESGLLTLLAGLAFIGLLIYQHRLVGPTDLSKVNLAFFTTNGVASLVFGLTCILDFYW
ncbi:4-hydroxybenzoate octaprenyltransferase [Lewinellaceae bacterium SD302]|nr:4-hydroxybenzoate octaprenyltransferase [Lewinellaceae bacterium SD302]